MVNIEMHFNTHIRQKEGAMGFKRGMGFYVVVVVVGKVGANVGWKQQSCTSWTNDETLNEKRTV